jgi:hypothetical protein
MAHRELPNIDTLGEAGDIAAPVGSREWAIAVRGELSVCLSDEASNRGRIKHLTGLLRESKGYERLSDARGKPFTSWRSFCVAPAPWGLKYDPALLDAIIDEHNQPIALRVEQAAQMTTGETLPNGTNRYMLAVSRIQLTSNERAEGAGISRATQTRLDYLARNAPELHEAVKHGEMGVRTAYDQARGTKKIEISADVDGAVRDLARKFTIEDLHRLVILLAERIAVDV